MTADASILRGPVAGVPSTSVAGLVRDACTAHSGVTALLLPDERLSYAELGRRVRWRAAALVERGVGTGDVVAVELPRGAAAVESALAVIALGAIYLPLDPEYPADRLRAVVDDAAPRLVLTSDEAVPDGPAPAWPTSPDDPDSALYAVYTSGSTGTPKGVVMTDGPLRNLLSWHRAALPCAPGTRVAQLSALGFDVALHELLATVTTGKTLVVPEPDVRRDPHRLAAWLAATRVEQLFAPTVVLTHLAAAADADGVPLAALHVVLQSGEPLIVTEPLREFLRARPALRILNQYGSAEMQDVLSAEPTGPVDRWPEPVPIGLPLQNTSVYLLDERLQPVPAGRPGRLFVGGAGLARGYLRRPGLTASRFVPDPFGPPGRRMYDTGDLGVREPDGGIRYAGRRDDQVKISGFRVELGEVDAVLAATPGILAGAAAAVTRGDRTVLVAAVVAPGADPAALRAALAARVPAQLVPARVEIVESLPTTPSGKTDRAAVAALLAEAGSVAAAGPVTAASGVAGLAAEALGHPVDPTLGLFANGGDSLTALVVAAAGRRAGVAIEVEHLLVGTPLARIATEPVTASEARPAAPLVLAESELNAVQRRVPEVLAIESLSPSEAGMLAGALASSHDPYLVTITVTLRGTLDPARLRAAADDLVARHESLRSAFLVDGVRRPVRAVAPPAPAPWTTTPPQRIELDRPPLFHVSSPVPPDRLPPGHVDELVLTITSHHLAVDGWSARVLVRDLLDAYDGVTSGAVARPPLRTPDATAAGRAADHWSSSLRDREPSVVADRGTVRGPASAELTVPLDPTAVDGARQRLRAGGRSFSALALTAWGLALRDELGSADAVFGTAVATRDPAAPGSADAVGLFIDTVPVLVSAPDVHSGVEEVAAALPTAARHGAIGLGAIALAARWPALFDTVVVDESDAVSLQGLRGARDGYSVAAVTATDRTEFAVSVLVDSGPAPSLRLTYDPARVDPDRVARLGRAAAAAVGDYAAAIARTPATSASTSTSSV
ncbi:amino acid adenylation domain-containing protein [Jatrophihabitans endophyticus]|uniref:amino acid adenylation domain-containing protein n=1 Tax=Jatrophihabitans endophyticus TaxID=1206085 RepID=UPI0009345F3C|nr:amino acid adenylation domain-containing protein [Jatrophihabitans endophyticus]